MGRIYLSAPDVGVREEELCVAALRSGWVAPLGPMVDAFEEALADRCARRYAVALSSGTAALHLALLELGAGPQDVVVVPTMTFAATANAVVYTGATPVFVDCDPHFGNLDPDLLEGALRSLRARRSARRRSNRGGSAWALCGLQSDRDHLPKCRGSPAFGCRGGPWCRSRRPSCRLIRHRRDPEFQRQQGDLHQRWRGTAHG